MDSISLLFLSSAISQPFCLGQAHTPPLFHSETALSLSLECFLLHALPLLSLPSLYHPIWGPSFTHSPLLSFLKSRSLSFYSLLLCCIPVSVVKGVDKEEGGKKRKGELEL